MSTPSRSVRSTRAHPGPGSAPAERAADALVRWFDDEVAATEGRYLAALTAEALALSADLRVDGAAASIPDTRALMALLMLTDFAVSKGLRVGEVAMLLPAPLTSASEALTVLQRRAESHNPNKPRVNHLISRRLGRLPPDRGEWRVSK